MSNEFEWEQPEDFGGGNFLRVAGTFHLHVLSIDTEEEDGKIIDGFRVKFEVVDGTVRTKEDGCTERRKTTTITFFNGKMSHKDSGRFARQKQAHFFVAANIIAPADVPALLAKKFRPDLDRARAQQLIATLKVTDDGKYMEVNGTDIYHIDDPAAKGFPKDADCLTLIPADCRRKPEELQAIKDAFAGKQSNGAGNGAANGNGSHAKSPAAANQPINLDDV